MTPAISLPNGNQLARTASGAVAEARNLTIAYDMHQGSICAVDDFNLNIAAGEVVGLVGESGSGKSTVAYAFLGWRARNCRILSGDVVVGGSRILSEPDATVRSIRGSRVSHVPQNPATSLSPHMRVGPQIWETLLQHRVCAGKREAEERTAELLRLVGLADAGKIARRYPHEISGGQQQRVLIAMALSCRPGFVVLDEPTTGLDATTRRQILLLLKELQGRFNLALLFVSHDLRSVSQLADRVAVMNAGRLVEVGTAADIFANPRHPYTIKLINSHPDVQEGANPAGRRRAASVSRDPLLKVEGLEAGYRTRPSPLDFFRSKIVPVAQDISLEIHGGEVLALIGESGSGKSTIARAITGMLPRSKGQVAFQGEELAASIDARSQDIRRRIQYIFQNPDASLNPRRRVGATLRRVREYFFRDSRETAEGKAGDMLAAVRLDRHYLSRYPGQLSGGERQRVAIARALLAEPDFLVCDEVLSALDVSVQASVLDLLKEIQRERRLAFLFIGHDLAIIRKFADQALILKDGRVVERGATDAIFAAPSHPYTRDLLADAGFGSPLRELAHTEYPRQTAGENQR